MDIRVYIERLVAGEDLDFDSAKAAMDRIISGKASAAQLAGFLTGLCSKGEAVDEIAGMAAAMRARCLRVDLGDVSVMDNTGTGGDDHGTFNISTAAAIVAAAEGVTIVKHGTGAISSKCGAAGVLNALGIKIDVGPRTVKRAVERVGIGFMFAPLYHPVLQRIVMPRYELGIKTVFDIIIPLINPAGVRRHVIGIVPRRLLSILVDVLIQLGAERILAFSSSDGMDELSLSGKNHIIEFDGKNKRRLTFSAADVGLKPAPAAEIRGGDANRNAVMIVDVLNGREGAPLRSVLFNAGAVIYAAGRAESLGEGIYTARETIRSGKAMDKLEQWQRFSRDAAEG